MTRVNLKGVAKTRKTLANGSVREYFYAWRGGPLLADKDGAPLKKSDETAFAMAYAAAHKARKRRPDGTMATLISMYRESGEFKGRAEKTKRDYRRYLDLIDDRFGPMPLDALVSPRARGKFKAWRDTMADRPRVADYAWTVLARVLSVAKDRGMIAVNVCERGGRLYESDRTEKIWLADNIKALLAVTSKPIGMAMLMALWTGQREGDLLRLQWSAYDGEFIKVKQGKTGARVKIPVSKFLKGVLDEEKIAAEAIGDGQDIRFKTILTNTRGKKWTESGFRSSLAKDYDKSGLPTDGDDKLTFHDLRGTAVTRLALAGCSTTQIASLSGHSLKDVEAILDAHYLGGRFELAEQAMQKLEQHEEQKALTA